MHSVACVTAFLPVLVRLRSANLRDRLGGIKRTLERNMRILVAIAAAAALAVSACTPADQNAAEQDANQAATETGQALEDAGQAVGDAASQTGEAIEGATNDAANSVANATDDNEATHP